MKMKQLVLALLLSIPFFLRAQLPEQEQKFLVRIKSELNLSAEQYTAVEKIYTDKQKELDACDKSIKEFEQTLDNEQELQMKVSSLNQKKKDIREMRELDVKLQLTTEQLKIYEEKIKPAKPQVLHFGIHDRANCKVCVQ
jgi:septal ring factor EnvC (AmiA/AmiB activator)